MQSLEQLTHPQTNDQIVISNFEGFPASKYEDKTIP